ncbi:MAG: hypothetical protein HY078_15640 [Elusimicrobia bacterium]|nr:hypothetical protein [Elusimicrobiota bacterium]
MNNRSTLTITLICIALGAASRLLPHPPNVTPLTAMALLGGAYLSTGQALVLPLAILFVSDLVLGLHSTIPFVYASFLVVALMGQWLKTRQSGATTLAACLGGSILFYAVTNFGVWMTSSMYPHTGSGLFSCYAAGLPFLRNSLVGDIGYTAVLFSLERFTLSKLAPAAATA